MTINKTNKLNVARASSETKAHERKGLFASGCRCIAGYCDPVTSICVGTMLMPLLCFGDIDLGPGPGVNGGGKTILLLLCIGTLILAVAFVLPSIIAFHRAHRYRWPILIINIVFGATVIGYVVALIWAIWPSGEKKLTANPGASSNEQEVKPTKNVPLRDTISGKVSSEQPTAAQNDDQSVMEQKRKELSELRNTLEDARKREYGTGKKIRRMIGKPIGIVFFLLVVISILAGMFPSGNASERMSTTDILVAVALFGVLGLIAFTWGMPNKKRIQDLEEKIEKLSADVKPTLTTL